MASHDEQISRFWDEFLRSGQPAAKPELDTGLTQAIERFQHRYAVSPPESTRERVRQRVLQSQSTSHEMESAMNLDAAILPPMSANGRTVPLPIPQRPTARRSRWFDSHWSLIQAAAALLLLAGLIGGIFIYAQGDRGSHPAVVPASPPATPASSWLQYRNGPAHLGVAANPGPSTLPLDLWSVPTQGAINSEPAIADGVLYIGSEDGHLYALDTSTGGQNWAFDAGSSVDTSPTIGDRLVYATDRNATLHAIDLATGESAWTFASANPNAAATLAGGVLYVAGNDTNLYALDPAKGTILWSFDTGANTGRTPAVANGVVYLGTESGQLFAVDAATGQRTWVFSGATGIAGSTVVDGAAIYQSFIHGSDDRLYALDAATGAELWSFGTPTKDTVWVPAVSGDTLYAPSNDGNIYALDTKTGAIRWQFAAEGPAESSGVLDDSTFYVADDTGYLYALDRATGAERWRLQVDDGATKGPALVDGVLYIGTTLGVVHAFAAPEPNVIGAPDMATPAPATPVAQSDQAELIWSRDTSTGTFQTPGGLSVDPSGRLWVFDGTNTIFILNADGNVVDTWTVDFNFTQGDGDVYGNAVFADNGDIYLLDAGTDRVLKFDAQRNLLTSWGSFGDGDGQFRSLVALAIAPNGDILAADDAQRRIQVFDPDGTFITSWDTGGDFADLVVAPNGDIYASSGCEVVVWDLAGNELDHWTASDSASCPYLSGLELNPDGKLFVSVASRPYQADAAGIAVFTADGTMVTQWNPRLDPANSADFDDAIVLDNSGNMYVLDYFAGTVAKFALHAPLTPATPAAS